MSRAPSRREIGHDLSHDGCELEAVAAESRRNGHIGVIGVAVQDEMAVGSQRVGANLPVQKWSASAWQMVVEEVADGPLIVGRDVARDVRRIE